MKSTLHDLMTGPSEEGEDTVVIERADQDEPTPRDDGSDGAGPPVDSLLDEDDYLPHASGGGPGKLTAILIAALVCAVGFFGGVQVQKLLGATSPSASGMPAGFPSRPAGGQGQGPAGPAGGADASASSAPTSSGADSGALAVVGTVAAVQETTLTVTDLGGTRHQVTITRSTPVTTTIASAGVTKGDTVSVNGTTQSDGTIIATSVTVR